MIERRVQDELARRKVVKEPTASPEMAIAIKDKTAGNRRHALVNQDNQIAANGHVKARRPLSKAERDQLAADLRLVSSGNERGVNLSKTR